MGSDQLVLRGATLRNTQWVHGLVIYTGHDTKLMQNSTRPPLKLSSVERLTNRLILFLVGCLLLISLGCAAGQSLWKRLHGDHAWYMDLNCESLGPLRLAWGYIPVSKGLDTLYTGIPTDHPMNGSCNALVRPQGSLWLRFDWGLVTNGAFPLQDAERIGSQRCGSGRVSTAKSGRDRDLAVPVLASFSGLLRWGTENETRPLKGSREILATHPLR